MAKDKLDEYLDEVLTSEHMPEDALANVLVELTRRVKKLENETRLKLSEIAERDAP